MKNDIGNQILGKIKSQNIKPRPKIYFVLGNILFWCFYSVSIIIGSVGLGIIFGFIFIDDITIIQRVGFLYLLAKYIPIFWIIFLFISVLFGITFFKKTESGYKHPLGKIVFLNFFLTFIGGFLLFSSGLSQRFDETLRNYFHTYNSFFVQDKEKRMIEIWQNEENGLLLGKIIEKNNSVISLEDTKGTIWKINYKNVQIKKMVQIEIGEKIKIIGKKIGNNAFQAEQIRPYFGIHNKQ